MSGTWFAPEKRNRNPSRKILLNRGLGNSFPRGERSLIYLIFCGVLSLGLGYTARAASVDSRQADPVIEVQLKAAFLFNFLKFTEWPPEALAPNAPLRLAVLTSSETAKIVAAMLKGKTVGDRSVEVIGFTAQDDWRNCHLLYIPRTSTVPLAAVLAALGSAPVLVVGESDQFTLEGGMIGFVQRGANIRFQVNLVKTQACKLKLSARLSSLAEIVKPREP